MADDIEQLTPFDKEVRSVYEQFLDDPDYDEMEMEGGIAREWYWRLNNEAYRVWETALNREIISVRNASMYTIFCCLLKLKLPFGLITREHLEDPEFELFLISHRAMMLLIKVDEDEISVTPEDHDRLHEVWDTPQIQDQEFIISFNQYVPNEAPYPFP